MSITVDRIKRFSNFEFVVFFQFSIMVVVAFLVFLASVWDELEPNQNNQRAGTANFNLAMMYIKGDVVPRDNVKAFQFLKTSAEDGFAESQYWMGRLLGGRKNWFEITKDQKRAVYWYLKASEQGHLASQLFLGRRYYQGDGVPKSLAEAKRWYVEAAKQGDAGAYYWLGLVSKGTSNEYMWLWLASKSKSLIPNVVSKEAKNDLQKLGSKLSLQEIIDAKYKALAWICAWGTQESHQLKIQC
jgi:TPR repeat protein